MKPIVNCLGVKKMDQREKSMAETLNDRVSEVITVSKFSLLAENFAFSDVFQFVVKILSGAAFLLKW